MTTTVTEETERAAQYVETKFEELGVRISAIIAEGMSYDLEVRKDGEKLVNLPAITFKLSYPPSTIFLRNLFHWSTLFHLCMYSCKPKYSILNFICVITKKKTSEYRHRIRSHKNSTCSTF